MGLKGCSGYSVGPWRAAGGGDMGEGDRTLLSLSYPWSEQGSGFRFGVGALNFDHDSGILWVPEAGCRVLSGMITALAHPNISLRSSILGPISQRKKLRG